MIKILFVCHGNICRSPMAEFLLKDYINKQGKKNDFYISSAATSTEEIGNHIYPPVKKILTSLNIDCNDKVARQIKLQDLEYYDLIICMDHHNVYNLKRMYGESSKIKLLNEYLGNNNDIFDPWYTREFDKCYHEINKGIIALYNHLISK